MRSSNLRWNAYGNPLTIMENPARISAGTGIYGNQQSKISNADGLIQDDASWIQLLNDRNLTSYLYDETTAQAIYHRIKKSYFPMFQNILGVMKN